VISVLATLSVTKYLLDTTVLIGHLRGRPEVVRLINDLASQGHQLGICGISLAELYSGLNPSERASADRLTDVLDFFQVSRESAKQAGCYLEESSRQGWTLTATDAILAATAIAEEAILITADARNFPIEDLQVLEHL
jgi:predicted nucleic acid-binding protein